MTAQPHYTVGLPRQEPARRSLFLVSLIQVALMAAMLVLGLLIATGSDNLRSVHAIIGYSTVVVGILAALAGWRYAKLTVRMGVFWHAVALPLLMLVQIALGEMGQRWVHIILGVLLAIGALGLTMMVRKPIPATI